MWTMTAQQHTGGTRDLWPQRGELLSPSHNSQKIPNPTKGLLCRGCSMMMVQS